MVTFESLMEPIVGELATGGLSRISVLPGGAAEIDGLVLSAEVNLQFGLHIDQDTFTTVGGFVLGQLGRRPHIGDVVAIDGRTLRVEALDGIRVARVKLSPPGVPAIQDSAKGRGSYGPG
jgi:putative hemolysin